MRIQREFYTSFPQRDPSSLMTNETRPRWSILILDVLFYNKKTNYKYEAKKRILYERYFNCGSGTFG
ncbi:hypothetical protein J7L09_02015 [bacterium]|nr:hypothetical protein [bacterium]